VSKYLNLVFKVLWRHRSRTILTILGSGVALFVFCFVGAIQEGMDDLQTRQAAKKSLVVFQANKFCPATSHLPEDYQQKIEKLPGVNGVMPIQVFTNNCRASLDVIVFYGAPPKMIRSAREFDLVAGSWQEFEAHQDAAIVGKAVANRRGIPLGGKFTIGDISVQVAGIYQADDPAEENYIYSHLDFLQRSKGFNLDGTVTQHEVLLSAEADPVAISEQIDTMFKGGAVETDTRPKGVFQADSLGDLTQLIAMARYLGYACVGIVLTLVATTTVMSVQDRMKEHAVMQTLGFSSFKVFLLVMTESIALSALGGLLGTVAAVLVLQTSNLAVAAEAVTVAFLPSFRLAAVSIAVALASGILAGVVPAWQAARVDILSALRS